MDFIIKAGILLVHLALINYTIFIYQEYKKQRAANTVIIVLALAVLFDISATTCMMIGTTRSYFTFHGIVGYSGLLLMMIDLILIWRHKARHGAEVLFSKGLNLFSKIAYVWWIIAFITGVVITINK
jgi:hypothetical protein